MSGVVGGIGILGVEHGIYSYAVPYPLHCCNMLPFNGNRVQGNNRTEFYVYKLSVVSRVYKLQRSGAVYKHYPVNYPSVFGCSFISN